MTLTIAFNYGGRAEIVDAVQGAGGRRACRPTRSTRRPSAATSTTRRCPTPTSSIRTSGEYRISNFLLWELAYSELVFTDVLWPDFRREHLVDAIARVPGAATAASAASTRRLRAMARGLYRDHGHRAAHLQAGRGRPHRRAAHRAATARCGPSPRACARPRAASAPGSSRISHVACSSTRAASSTSSPRPRRIDHFRAAPRRPRPAAPGRSPCSRRSTSSPRSARPNPRLYQMLLGALRTLAARDAPAASCRRSSGSCWPLEGFRPGARRAASRCGAPTDRWWPSTSTRAACCAGPAAGARRSAPDALDLLRRILGGELDGALDEPASPATHEVEHLATRAIEHHLERRLRAGRPAGSGVTERRAKSARRGARRRPGTLRAPLPEPGLGRPAGRRPPRRTPVLSTSASVTARCQERSSSVATCWSGGSIPTARGGCRRRQGPTSRSSCSATRAARHSWP